MNDIATHPGSSSIVDADHLARVDLAARAVDVHLDLTVWIVLGKVQELGDDKVGTVVVHYPLQEHDAVLEQPAVNVEDTLFPPAAFNHIGNKGHDWHLRASPTP